MDFEQDDPGGHGRYVVNRRALVVAALSALGLVSVADAAQDKQKRETGKKKQKTGGSARDVVRTAQKYKGAKYKWGGASPKGFTWYVYNKATGMDITRSVTGQWKHGKSVGRGDWKPGDIVFFKNTFERGLSHNGSTSAAINSSTPRTNGPAW